MPFCTIPEAIEELKAGRMIVLVDDEDRENEGDLVIAAEKVTPEAINFMLTHARGVLCLSLTGERCDRLQLHPQVDVNTTQLGTAFTVTIDAHKRFGITTGVSARDRATTIQVAIAEDAQPQDLVRPGHINPLRARDGGVLVRAGQTEGSVDLARLAGLKPAAVICEIMREDGEMARRPELEVFCQKHGLKMCTIADLISYRLKREQFVKRIETITLPTRWGLFKLIAYQSVVDSQPHLALCKGGVGDLDESGRPIPHEEPVLVRVHSECLTGDVFGSGKCDCGEQLATAMQMIERAGKGVLVYLRQEGRGVGLANKLHAYALQERGLDTVEANQRLGLPVDKRDYGIGSQILRDLGLKNIRIMTNNPKKIYGIEGYGLHVVEEVPIRIEPNEYNRGYLATKKTKLGHKL
ncbi:bifunctional 3,4-dihydroxy-2-butanone-4-phosphate synthase/GTP cyclohydrolase II [Fontivita pretiosa]|jgi:3,4-dihydroxy 2-butanone 4-phosphate synthase/GTP cyclohydrolase II|uniref:bifunctional 3,4-dihydroxy-2-butanone-4-phosphate synthase/GTP cyclohydrolase II n=1 Tax=Fontivita pretiosa TaxID=2989684 RepID=UPI003D17B8F2